MALFGVSAATLQEFGNHGVNGMLATPGTMVKTLIQLGYEPMPAEKGKNFLGMSGYWYPGFFSYAYLMYKRHGFWSMFDGCLANGLYHIFFDIGRYIGKRIFWGLHGPTNYGIKEGKMKHLTVMEDAMECVHETVLDFASASIGVIVAQPFFVIGARIMAQHASELPVKNYTSTFQAFRLILNQEGLQGLFSGLVPALLQELIYIFCMSVFVRVFNRLLVTILAANGVNLEDQKPLTLLTNQIAMVCSSSFFYPFALVKTIMAVNPSGFPMVCQPRYSSWVDCFNDLRELGWNRKGLMRGASIFRRFYSTP
eukprot:m.124774 g.124774  ORF g.124774 m.124774 type:complete len:311 (+) comp23432_c0_seq3:320-1252(+)